MTKYIKILLISAVALSAVYGGWYFFQKNTAQKGRSSLSVTVESAKVATGQMKRKIFVVGVLSANNSIMIRPETSGKIKEILFKEGTLVQEGDLLFTLDDALAQANYKDAQATLTLHKAQYERALKLYNSNIGTAKDKERAWAELQSSQAKLEIARVKLDQTQIRAPFSGIIGITDLSPGAYITEKQDLVSLVSIHPMKVDFHIPEVHIRDIQPGQKLSVKVDGHDEIFRATIEAIDSRVDQNVHMILIRALIPNPDRKLTPGSFARIHLKVATSEDAILVPDIALERSGDEEFVYRIVNGRAARTSVITGMRSKGQVEVLEGLVPGDEIITVGHVKLRDGFPVKVTNSQPHEQSEQPEDTVTDSPIAPEEPATEASS